MRDLQLLDDYLVRLRQERLQQGHARALDLTMDVIDIRIAAFEAELCTRIRVAIKALEHDSGKFIEDFLK
jgi:hypothetical protein